MVLFYWLLIDFKYQCTVTRHDCTASKCVSLWVCVFVCIHGLSMSVGLSACVFLSRSSLSLSVSPPVSVLLCIFLCACARFTACAER